MNKIHSNGRASLPTTLAAVLSLAMTLTFSCTSNIEMPPSPDNFVEAGGSSSSGSNANSLGSSSSVVSSSSQGGQTEGNVETKPCQYQPEWCNDLHATVGYVPTIKIDGWVNGSTCFFATDITMFCPYSSAKINGITSSGNVNCWSNTGSLPNKIDGGYYVWLNENGINTPDWAGTVGTSPVCVDKCNGTNYDPAERFCYDKIMYPKCGGRNGLAFNPVTHGCWTDNTIKPKCGGLTGELYDPATHFCFDDTEILKKCGGKEYNPNLHRCASEALVCLSPLPSGYFCDVRDSNVYQQVVINSKTWMAENLKIRVPSGTSYYSGNYTWAVAMDGKASSTANPSGVQGICPKDWHIPSLAEWQAFLPSVNYWTTTEYGTYAYVNDITYATKTTLYPVRCVMD
ncbi:MAG: hypothetical protein LBH25_01200 [Fibromonadaceae bacterium]|jgi:hypothetical protein|nr:hypothetical protein [Fibromonadaceae bacterium]